VYILLRGFVFRLIFTGAGFLVSLIIARLAGTGQFGTLSLMIVNAAFIYIITGLGTDAAIVWHGIAAKNYDRDKIFSFTIITTSIQLLFFYIIAILGFFFLGHSLLGGSYGLKIFFAEIVYFTGLVITEKFTSLFYSQHEAKLCNRILAIVSSLLFLALVLIWVMNPIRIKEDPVWLYSLFIFLPAFILLVAFFIKYKPVMRKISEEEYRSFSAFSAMILITNAVQFIAYRVDYWIITLYYDHDAVGVYAQASKFAQLLWIVPAILAGLMTPALKNQAQRLTETDLVAICRVTFFMHLVLTLLLIMAALAIYNFFLPDDYYNGFFALLIMIPGYLFFIFSILLAAYFSANRLLKINLFTSLLCCCTIVLLDFLLIPVYSYKGAAIANLAGYSIASCYIIVRTQILLNVAWRDFFIIKRSDVKIFAQKMIDTNDHNIPSSTIGK
jgi:O-antigen/teichoic acid export membrane protein